MVRGPSALTPVMTMVRFYLPGYKQIIGNLGNHLKSGSGGHDPHLDGPEALWHGSAGGELALGEEGDLDPQKGSA